MPDNLTKAQRSMTMSKIRSRGTGQENEVHNWLKIKKIKHKMHPKLDGNPDLIIPEKKLAIFLHGCFWHKCPKHFKMPKQNRAYWQPKLEKNKIRDKKNEQSLERQGWKVKIVWEHEIKKDLEKAVSRLVK